MKSNNISLIMRLHFFVFAIALLLGSCSKEGIGDMSKDDTTSLLITVTGANPINDNIKLKAQTNQSNTAHIEQKNHNIKRSSKNNRLNMNIESGQDLLGFDLDQSVLNNSFTKQAKASPIDGNVKYIFILQRVSNGEFTHKKHYSINTPRTDITDLVTNEEYKWYAYSYLTEDNISVPDPDISASIPTFHDKTLVHASGQFKAVGGQNNIAIIFDHQLTQINVEVNVKKAYANITNIKGQLFDKANKIKTGTFDFITGNKANHTAANIIEEDLIFENKIAGDNSVKVAHYYTSDPSLTEFRVIISELTVQYLDGTTEVLNTRIPNGGTLNFGPFDANNSGHMLKGKLNLGFTLPMVKIMVFSNNDDDRGYRLAIGSGPGDFLRNQKWFGPTSEYVAIDSVAIDNPYLSVNDIYFANHSSTNQNRLATHLANPANYPEILIIANWYNYLNEASWNAVKRYLDAGGIVLHTQDENESNIAGARQADKFMSNLLGQTVSIVRGSQLGRNDYEMRGVYKFTDTREGAADTEILNGVFGDVRPYHWGQDRYGTMYVVGYTGNDLIVYSDHAQNYPAQATPGLAFFRHKTKKYFYVGDGGFYHNKSKGDYNNAYNEFPFRSEKTGVNMDFPIITNFGEGAKSNSPMYNAPVSSGLANDYYRTNNKFQIANSMMFGNMMAWMMEQAYLNPVDKTGPVVNP